jgi:hypothetical protein
MNGRQPGTVQPGICARPQRYESRWLVRLRADGCHRRDYLAMDQRSTAPVSVTGSEELLPCVGQLVAESDRLGGPSGGGLKQIAEYEHLLSCRIARAVYAHNNHSRGWLPIDRQGLSPVDRRLPY